VSDIRGGDANNMKWVKRAVNIVKVPGKGLRDGRRLERKNILSTEAIPLTTVLSEQRGI